MDLRPFAALAVAGLLAAAPVPRAHATAEDIAELTAVDITQRPTLTSSRCAVFGVRLGMSKEAVLKHIGSKDLLWGYYNGYLLTEKKFSNIIYVYDRLSSEAVGGALFRLRFDPDGRLDAITLYPAMGKYLVGESKRLVDQEVLEPTVRRRLLGPADQVESEELPIIDLKLDIFHYRARGFQIRHKHSYSKRTDEVYFSLLPPQAP
ncbi:MAG: hypothetical protein ACE5KY_02990 [Candidatus Tectimicrobiota bacterium]